MLAFGPFQLYRDRKMLLDSGRPVRLGSRAIDLLIALVERAGEMVGKNELMACVWPNTVVEENNLRVHIAALRKCLGEGQAGARYIVNVAGRGYCFVAPVTRGSEPVPGLPSSVEPRGNLPAAISRPVGRSEAVAALKSLLARHRLVTIVGAGGVGKSTVALAVAERLGDLFQQNIFFADLAPIVAPSMAAAAIASAVDASLHAEDPVGSLISNLRDTRMLLLLDNCEHVIGHIAEIAVRLLRSTQVTILATSREPLLADGEQVYQLASLDVPPQGQGASSQTALSYSAVQLFAERALNGSDTFALTDANAAAVSAICRMLDGVPLAIEIVAARAALVGVHALDLEANDADILAVSGRRTASSRHRSLRATLDWSYRHLSPIERSVLQWLSVFRGRFSAAAAISVIATEGLLAAQVLDALMSLAAKSLLVTETSGSEFNYRLLHVTRVYASELLTESGGAQEAQRRHAEHWCQHLKAMARDDVSLTRARRLTLHQASIDDVRAALEWAFSSAGDERLGARLTMAAVSFGFHLSLIDEFKQRTAWALAAVRRFVEPDPELEVQLGVARNILHNKTADPDELVAATLEQAVTVARESVAPQNTIWALTVRSLTPLDFGDYANAVQALAELDAAARKDDNAYAALSADRVGAMVLHWSGSHARARVLAERVLRHPAGAIPPVYGGSSVDRRVSMRVVLSRILWLEGAADQARDLAAEAVDLAASDQPNAVCDALGHAACPIAFWRGDLDAARTHTQALLDWSHRYTITRWYIAALCFQKILAAEDGENSGPTPLPGLQRDLLATMTHRWVDATTVDRGRRQLAGWCSPELLRVSGELKRLEPSDEAERSAEMSFLRALECAREQRALAWELRAATSLARLWMQHGRRADAERVLRSIHDRFTEGLDTADLRQARALLSGTAIPD
jgi:predicted ATPase/DNA-binding winged helix-turn-helix (wHTH) protein